MIPEHRSLTGNLNKCGFSSGSLPAVKTILEIAGEQSLEQRDSNNRTPLILATMGGHGEVVNFLLSKGGKSVCGNRIVQSALWESRLRVLRLLVM